MQQRSQTIRGGFLQFGEDCLPTRISWRNHVGGDDPIEVRLKVATLERQRFAPGAPLAVRKAQQKPRHGEADPARLRCPSQRLPGGKRVGTVVETAKLNAQHGSVVSVQRHVQLRFEPREYLIQVIAVDRNGFAGCECPYDVAVAVGPATEISE